MGTSSSYFLGRFSFIRAVAVVGLVCLLIFGSLVSGGRTGQASSTSTQWSAESVRHEQVVATNKPNVDHADLDFNYMSKRRVPNGPDPIHNRRAGNSGRPPGTT